MKVRVYCCCDGCSNLRPLPAVRDVPVAPEETTAQSFSSAGAVVEGDEVNRGEESSSAFMIRLGRRCQKVYITVHYANVDSDVHICFILF